MLNCAALQLPVLSEMQQGPATWGSGQDVWTARCLSTGHTCAGRKHLAAGVLCRLCVLSKSNDQASNRSGYAPEPDMAPLAALLFLIPALRPAVSGIQTKETTLPQCQAGTVQLRCEASAGEMKILDLQPEAASGTCQQLLTAEKLGVL